MKIGSLFSGIGGLELGLESAGVGHTLWQVEAEAFPRSILARHWPGADRSVCDVRLAGSHNLAPVEVICGGFPCQDISTAGLGAGLDGRKSGLWFEYARILREVRPRFVVVENVASLLVRGLDRVLGSLAELGYDAEWSTLSAAEVGAPHLRRRLFIIGWLPNAERQPRRTQPRREIWSGRAGAALVGVDGGSEHVADGDGGRREELRLSQPRREQGARRGLVDGRGSVRELQHAADLGHADHAGRGEQRGTLATRAELPPAECAGGRGTQPRVGRASHGLLPWAYRGEDPERWERGVSRTVPPRSVPQRPARLRALGNSVVPQCAHEVGLRLLEIAERLA